MSYSLVSPEDFTAEQKQFMESIKDSFRSGLCPSLLMPEVRSSIKDIHSRHVIGGEYAAITCGLGRAEELAGLLDSELPCKVADFAQDFVDEDRKLLSHPDGNKQSVMLSILEYSTGLTPFYSHKYPLKHEPSKSIIGIVASSQKVNLSYFLTLLPNYLRTFGIAGNIESISDTSEIEGITLTEYEHEVAFLMTMNWKSRQIADFMNKYRPISTQRVPDTIYKCRNRICEKFDCETWHLRDKLIALGVHRKMPNSFFRRLIGVGNTPIPS